jgi:hypothetical protein
VVRDNKREITVDVHGRAEPHGENKLEGNITTPMPGGK